MNPWPVARAALRTGWRGAVAMALLVALAVAMGVAVGVVERGLRRAAAGAADAFDLVVGAPGGGVQLVLAAVYLQPDTVPLLDGAVMARVMGEGEAAWASPLGFGDQWRGHPVVGVAPAFVTWGGRRDVIEGAGVRGGGRGRRGGGRAVGGGGCVHAGAWAGRGAGRACA